MTSYGLMAIILKHKKTIRHSEQHKINVQNNVENWDKFKTSLTEKNGRKNPFNTSEVKYFEVRVFDIFIDSLDWDM